MPEGGWLLAAGAAFAVSALAAGPLLALQARAGPRAPAFDGRLLPAAGGLVPTLGLVAGLAMAPPGSLARALALAALGGALWGLLDDVATGGGRGWRAHVGGLLRGTWTAGSAKVVGIAAAGWLAAGDLLGGMAVALTANLVNVLDRRPTRAVKAFFLLAGILAAAAPDPARRAPLLPLLAVGLAWLPLDAGRRAMLGDTGANALGAALGLLAAEALPPGRLLAWLAAAAALQGLADRRSLSRWIDGCPPLRWLDRLGVAGEGTGRVATNTGGTGTVRPGGGPAIPAGTDPGGYDPVRGWQAGLARGGRGGGAAPGPHRLPAP